MEWWAFSSMLVFALFLRKLFAVFSTIAYYSLLQCSCHIASKLVMLLVCNMTSRHIANWNKVLWREVQSKWEGSEHFKDHFSILWRVWTQADETVCGSFQGASLLVGSRCFSSTKILICVYDFIKFTVNLYSCMDPLQHDITHPQLPAVHQRWLTLVLATKLTT